jgi:hypothetical protein
MNLSDQLKPLLNLEVLKATFLDAGNGGSSTADTWSVWPFDTDTGYTVNGITGASISSSQISLPAGRFIVVFGAAPREYSKGRFAWYDVTNDDYLIKGPWTFSHPSNSFGIRYLGMNGVHKADDSAVYEVRYYFDTSQGTNGLGVDIGSLNQYGHLLILKCN